MATAASARAITCRSLVAVRNTRRPCCAAQSVPRALVQSLRATCAPRRPPSTRTFVASSEVEEMVSSDPKVNALRSAMAAANVQAFIVPSEDPHMSEYAPSCFARREFISKFDGSAGTAVVSADKAMLWTDGRYFLQATQQLGPAWQLMKAGIKGVPTIKEWLCRELPAGSRVGIDPYVHTLFEASELKAALEEAGKILVPLETNPVDIAWGADRPAPPTNKLRVHPLSLAGEAVADKVRRMAQAAAEKKADGVLVTALDEVAWLLNLRGADVAFNPVFLSYVIIADGAATLYVDAAKLTPEVSAHLNEGGVRVKGYEDALADFQALARQGKRILVDPKKVSYAFARAAMETDEERKAKKQKVEDGAASPPSSLVQEPSIVSLAKAVKNPVEMDGMREAHLRDAVALASFFCWLEGEVAKGAKLDEVAISDKLLGFRRQQPGFIEPSFPTIAGADANGAIIHYRPVLGENNKTVKQDTMLLVDSGGQYDCGTTDVTRTVHFGTPTDKQRRAFTAVLKGHVALDVAVFPEGTPGFCLDTLARTGLWALGLEYRHGTGHGVGAALNVHEGPQSISQRYTITQGLLDGMIMSNEPGYYEDGGFGIRIENLVIVQAKETPYKFDPAIKSLGFERLTMHPIQKKLVAVEMLSPAELEWLSAYHQEILDKVSGRIADADVKAWLERQCREWTKH